MVIMENRIGERLCHVAYDLSLCYQVQRSMLDKLQYVWRPIGSVKNDVPRSNVTVSFR